MFLFEKIDKKNQFNSSFLGIPGTFISVRVRQVAFFIWEMKKVVYLKQCPLYVLTALEMRKREVYRKQTIAHVSIFLSKVSALEHDRFSQASLYTVSLLFANTLA